MYCKNCGGNTGYCNCLNSCSITEMTCSNCGITFFCNKGKLIICPGPDDYECLCRNCKSPHGNYSECWC